MAPRRSTAASIKPGKAVARAQASGRLLTKADAVRAAKAAKEAFAAKAGKWPAAWKRGGREWERLLGHFGAASR